MLLSTGVDSIEVHRIAQSIDRYGERFLHRIYTDGEIAYCNRKRNSAESFAARFAAKEAVSKALGTGMNLGVTWRDIEVTRAASGRPSLKLTGAALRVAERLGTRTTVLSLTHTQQLATALVIFES